MKVADVMSKQVEYVTTETSVKEVSRLIFGRGINGVPVCKEKKLVGMITEQDILDKFYPSIQEFVADYVHSSNFEGMEEKVEEVFDLPARRVMNKDVVSIRADVPLLKAQSLMKLKDVGSLPVVDSKGNLIGIIAKGDIFRSIIGDKLPLSADEEYHDWLSRHYDMVVSWSQRLNNEIPDLVSLFRRKKVQNVLDIGCGTGEHDIALVKEGFDVLGMETSSLMHIASVKKRAQLSEKLKQKVNFATGDYIKVLDDHKQKFNAAILLGNSFCHLDKSAETILKSVSNALFSKDSVVVLQLINYEKVFKVKKRILDMNFNSSKLGIAHEHAFLEFYDKPKKAGDSLTLNMAIFDFDGKKWKFRSMNSTPIANLDREKIKKMLEKYGFKKVSFFGGVFSGTLLKEPFNPLESDYLNVVAER